MSGTIPISMTQQFDVYGEPLSGGQLYIIAVGTISTPQDAFQDFGLTIKQPYPMVLDAAGRVPQFFLADGFVKIRLTDRTGVVQLSSDSVMVIGPSSGSGGGGGTPVEASATAQTGDIKARYGTGLHPGVTPGWVRCNGRTIGAALSSATERNNEDTRALFIHLYSADPNLPVIGGRSGNANNDFDLGKQMTLPDGRGTVLAGMDDMGSTAIGRLTSSWFGANATVLGARGGLENHTIVGAQMPGHSHTGQTGTESQGHTHGYTNTTLLGAGTTLAGGSPWRIVSDPAARTGGVDPGQEHIHYFETDLTGGNAAHNNTQPTMVVTYYIKL